jgi:plasmid stabilization system protein ParE
MIDSEFHPAANLEYERAIDWYLAKSFRAASRFVTEVETAIESICQNPDRYPRWDEQYRFYLLKRFPYFVAYRHTSTLVVIIAIRHAAQDQDAWKSR